MRRHAGRAVVQSRGVGRRRRDCEVIVAERLVHRARTGRGPGQAQRTVAHVDVVIPFVDGRRHLQVLRAWRVDDRRELRRHARTVAILVSQIRVTRGKARPGVAGRAGQHRERRVETLVGIRVGCDVRIAHHAQFPVRRACRTLAGRGLIGEHRAVRGGCGGRVVTGADPAVPRVVERTVLPDDVVHQSRVGYGRGLR